MRAPRLLAAALLLAMPACGRDEPPPSTHVAAGCTSREGGSRWSGRYHQTALFGDTEDEAIVGLTLAGVAAADSVIYVMESGRARLWLLRPDLSVIRWVGRNGRGPGEWTPSGPATQGGSMARVDAPNGRVRLYDGQRIQELDQAGRFVRLAGDQALAMGISPLQSRHRYVGDTLLFSRGGYDPFASAKEGTLRRLPLVGGRSPWFVVAREGARERTVLTLGLVPLRRGAGVGPQQARPLWDSNGGCVVATDGAGPLLMSVALAGGRVDTATAPLPDPPALEDDDERLRGVLPPGYHMDPPTAVMRIRDLVLDPDGYAWLLPVQNGSTAGGVEVIRVAVATGAAVRDTVPAFPRLFTAPGVFYAETRSPDGAVQLARFDRG